MKSIKKKRSRSCGNCKPIIKDADILDSDMEISPLIIKEKKELNNIELLYKWDLTIILVVNVTRLKIAMI